MRFVLHKMVHLGLISPKSEQCLLSQDIWSCNQTPSSNSKVLHGTARVKSPHILYVQHVGGSVLKKNNVQICYCYEKGQTLQIALKARRNGFLLLLWWHMWYKSKGKKKSFWILHSLSIVTWPKYMLYFFKLNLSQVIDCIICVFSMAHSSASPNSGLSLNSYSPYTSCTVFIKQVQ